MNTSQTTNIITSLIVAALGGLVTKGWISSSDALSIGGSLAAILVIVIAHFIHAAPTGPTNASSKTSVYGWLIVVALVLAFTSPARAQTSPNGSTVAASPGMPKVTQAGTIFGLFGGGTSTNGFLVSAGKGAGDALAFIEGNTNGWARICIEAGYLRAHDKGNGGFLNLLIPLSGTNNILGAGFGIAYIDRHWYDATLSARLGANIPIKIGSIDLSSYLPLYAYTEAGGGYNFGTSQTIAQSFAGASLHYILVRLKSGNTVDLTAGIADGVISDVPGNTFAAGGSVTFSF